MDGEIVGHGQYFRNHTLRKRRLNFPALGKRLSELPCLVGGLSQLLCLWGGVSISLLFGRFVERVLHVVGSSQLPWPGGNLSQLPSLVGKLTALLLVVSIALL